MSDTGDIYGDKERQGTDVTQTNIDSVMSNIPFFKHAIRREKNASSLYDKQYWANRMFNVDAVATTKTDKFFKKEFENLSNITDMANRARAMTGDIDLSDDEYISWKTQSVTVDVPVSSNTRFNFKDPSVIIDFQQTIKEIYRRLEREDKAMGYPGSFQKIFTFFVLRAGIEEHLEGKFSIPYFKEVMKVTKNLQMSSVKTISMKDVCAALNIDPNAYTRNIKPILDEVIATVMKTTVADIKKGRPARLKLVEDVSEATKLVPDAIIDKLEKALKTGSVTLNAAELRVALPALLAINKVHSTSIYSELTKKYGTDFHDMGIKYVKKVLSGDAKAKTELSRLISEPAAASKVGTNEDLLNTIQHNFASFVIFTITDPYQGLESILLCWVANI